MRTDEVRVIENILALEAKRASEVMTPRSVMVALPQEISVEEARNRPGVMAHSRIPVYEKTPDGVVGVVLRRDLLTAVADGRGDAPVSQLMRPAELVTAHEPLDALLRKMLERREHLVVVLDEHGGVAGIATLEDVLEEILGSEIVDEVDDVVDKREMARLRRDELLGPES